MWEVETNDQVDNSDDIDLSPPEILYVDDEEESPLDLSPPEMYYEDRASLSYDVTWSVLTKVPGFDDILEKAGNSLDVMFDQLGYRPFVDYDDNDRLYLCRYEFKKTTGAFTHTDGIVDEIPGDKNIYLDFLTGFPLDCIELFFTYGEDSSRYGNDERTQEKHKGVTPPVPAAFFDGYTSKRVLVDYTAMDVGIDPVYCGKYMAENLAGTPEPEGVKWWCRTNVLIDDKFPIPGEFVGLGVRMMPGEFSGHQHSSPFTYAGNWIDYVYYSSGKVIAVNDEGEIPTLTVQWRKYTLTLKTTDYAQYAVGDRVTILKDVEASKDTQTWDDSDAKSADATKWVVAPVMFYDMECRD